MYINLPISLTPLKQKSDLILLVVTYRSGINIYVN